MEGKNNTAQQHKSPMEPRLEKIAQFQPKLQGEPAREPLLWHPSSSRSNT